MAAQVLLSRTEKMEGFHQALCSFPSYFKGLRRPGEQMAKIL
jgi:hypothetical protein